MDVKIISNLLYHIQNCGSKEDILTATLATMFQYSPEFTQKLLQTPEIFGPLPSLEEWVNSQWVDTGYRLCPKVDLTWLRDEEIDFKPDILISDKREGYWKERPRSQFFFFIEAKLYEDLSENQIRNYPAVHTEFEPSIVKTLLISVEIGEADRQFFDRILTWKQVLTLSRAIIPTIQSPEISVLLNELHLLLKMKYQYFTENSNET